MGIQYNYSILASSQCLPIPTAKLHVRKRWKRNIQVNGWRNSARSPYVSFLETRNAQGTTFILVLFLGNETRAKSGFVSYVSFFRPHYGPLPIVRKPTSIPSTYPKKVST